MHALGTLPAATASTGRRCSCWTPQRPDQQEERKVVCVIIARQILEMQQKQDLPGVPQLLTAFAAKQAKMHFALPELCAARHTLR
jgi:hypothetical protein